MKRTPILAALLLGLAPSATADQIFAIAWPSGAYTIDSTTGVGQPASSPAATGLNSLARGQDGRFYSADSAGNLITVDPASDDITVVAALNFGAVNLSIPSMAFSPGGTLYVINREFPDALYTVNLATGVGTRLGSTGGFTVQGLAFAPDGALYGWDIFQGLLSIDPATGAATDVSSSEGATANIQCLAFSPEGVLYGAQYGLFTIDPTTGVPTAVGAGNLSDIRGMDFNIGPAFRLTITPVEAGLKICCSTSEGQMYRIQRRDGFEPEFDWENLGNPFAGTGGEICVTNQASLPRRFFRAVTQLPAN